MNIRFSLLISIVFFLFSAHSYSQDIQRGLKNYDAIMRGEKKLEQLSPAERREVLIVYQRISTNVTDGEKSQDCQSALSRAQSAASDLGEYARKLRNCAESKDYNEDCSLEFRRVKTSYSDYESAIFSVRSYCQ